MKNKLFSLIRVVVSFAFIAFLLWVMRDKWGEIIGIVKNIDLTLLITGCALFVLAPFVLGERIRCLLSTQKIFLNRKEAASLTFIGFFFNNFLPTAIGGDFVKAYYASKKANDKVGCFATVFMDRMFGMASLFILAGLVLPFSRGHIKSDSVTWLIFAVLGLLALGFLVLWNKKIARMLFSPAAAIAERWKVAEKFKRAYNTMNSLKDKKGLFFRVFLLSVSAQLICFLAAYFWLMGLGNAVSVQAVFLIMPLVSVLAILPSINGLGIREGAMVFFFAPYAGTENAFTLSLLWLSMLLVVSVIGGLNYALGSQYRIAKEEINDRQRAS